MPTNTSNTNPSEEFNDGNKYQVSKISSFQKVTGSASRNATNKVIPSIRNIVTKWIDCSKTSYDYTSFRHGLFYIFE